MMILLIYSFSAQDGEVSGNLSYQVSYKIVEIRSEIMHQDKDYDELYWEAKSIEYYVRKAAHMTEYFILAACVSFPLYVYGMRGFWMMTLTLFLCIVLASFDEFHQSFVDGRGASVKDVFIDNIGAIIGIIMVQAFCWSAGHPPKRKKRKK